MKQIVCVVKLIVLNKIWWFSIFDSVRRNLHFTFCHGGPCSMEKGIISFSNMFSPFLIVYVFFSGKDFFIKKGFTSGLHTLALHLIEKKNRSIWKIGLFYTQVVFFVRLGTAQVSIPNFPNFFCVVSCPLTNK